MFNRVLFHGFGSHLDFDIYKPASLPYCDALKKKKMLFCRSVPCWDHHLYIFILVFTYRVQEEAQIKGWHLQEKFIYGMTECCKATSGCALLA